MNSISDSSVYQEQLGLIFNDSYAINLPTMKDNSL